jgi:MYXO-CTERM domain-containing protein
VCCNSACGQRCFSCALLNTPGQCTQEPTGVDLKSECGPALSCLGTCGPDAQCIGAGTGTMCARNRCTGPSTGAGPAYCSAPGAKCNTDEAVPFDCSPFVCEPAFGACRTQCTSSNDCAQGFVCDTPTKTCVAAPPPPAETSEDGCAVSSPGASRGGLAVAGVLIAIGVAMRRRRALMQSTRR